MRTRRVRNRQSQRQKHCFPETLPEGQEMSTEPETTPPQVHSRTHLLLHSFPQPSGSELNNVSGGSPSSGESPSSSRKKPRIDEGLVPATEEGSPDLESESEQQQERRVLFLSQYLCISLWRALESCEIWDSRLVSAFVQGPRTFAHAVSTLVKDIHRRIGNTQPDVFVKSYLSKIRPRGLYSSCAKILQKTRIPTLVRSLKRKKVEEEEKMPSMEDVDMQDNVELSVLGEGRYKYCFIMDEPRLIFLNGPEKDANF